MTYISVDVETDGPIPGDYSMLQLGAAAFGADGKLRDKFSINLKPLIDARQFPDTMKFWAQHPDQWEAMKVTAVDPEPGMYSFFEWVKKFSNQIFVGYPVTFDFMFVHWYMIHFLGKDPFGFQGLDLKTYAMSVLGTQFKNTTKRTMPREWFEGLGPHTHVAVEDAVEQGHLFFKIQAYANAQRGVGLAFKH